MQQMHYSLCKVIRQQEVGFDILYQGTRHLFHHFEHLLHIVKLKRVDQIFKFSAFQ